MRKFLLIVICTTLVSCKKDKETISEKGLGDSTTTSVLDSIQIPTFENADLGAAFEIARQNIKSEKGRAIFMQNKNVIFYFDQNENKGNIRIDGKDYGLNKFDFTENNYSISGNGVEIEAINGDFKDGPNDCVRGNFPEVKVSLNDKTVNLTDIAVQDCPNY